MRRECSEYAAPRVPQGVFVEGLVTTALAQIKQVINDAIAVSSDPLFTPVNGLTRHEFVSLTVTRFVIRQVRTGGAWDYKNQPGWNVGDAFGNWFFGIVSAQAGFEPSFATFGAGMAQVASDIRDGIMPSTFTTFGDQPRDTVNINAGMRFFYAGCTKLGL